MSRILVVDDEESICWSFREFLTEEGHQVETAASAEEAIRVAGARGFDAVVLDVRLPGLDGLSAMPRLRERLGTIPIVVMTAFGDLETAVKAVEAEAFDYLVKPFDLDRASSVVKRALELSPTRATAATDQAGEDTAMIGSAPAMQHLFKKIAMVAATDVSVLITGESGTGKELVARALHRYGTRRLGPFVPVCLPALSPSLIEAELFGHVKGAFTGATGERKGVFELAHGGTVLLDEIGDATLSLQVKLLRAIEHREVTPVGDARPRPIDLRVVAATHRPLPALVASGAFREDLYFRLAAFPIQVPPLRDRAEDIPALASHFLRKCRSGGDQYLAPEILAALRSRPWPGNVRELRHAVEHAAILARNGPIRPEHLPASGAEVSAAQPAIGAAVAAWGAAQDLSAEADLYSRFQSESEPPLLRAVLARCGGNRASAAQILGIDRATLRQKLRRYGIE
ncbi:MAG: Transcriptional regulator [Planctomycetota bacterium]|nr:Transcriptional regulator [Planctomycetota bacterium]